MEAKGNGPHFIPTRRRWRVERIVNAIFSPSINSLVIFSVFTAMGRLPCQPLVNAFSNSVSRHGPSRACGRHETAVFIGHDADVEIGRENSFGSGSRRLQLL